MTWNWGMRINDIKMIMVFLEALVSVNLIVPLLISGFG